MHFFFLSPFKKKTFKDWREKKPYQNCEPVMKKQREEAPHSPNIYMDCYGNIYWLPWQN